MEFLTDKIRANIYKKCVNRDNLETFFDGNQGDFNFEMLLIDYYNILMFKRTTNDITQYEINNLELINKYTVKELKGLICDFQFVKSLLTAGISFYELARLDRQQIVRISHDWHNKNDLTSRVLYHINYMSNIPSYDLQTLIDYYVEYININGKDLIIYAIPIAFVESVCLELKNYVTNQHHCIATKGIEQKNNRFVKEIIETNINTDKIAVLSGASFAIDTVKDLPIGLTLASKNNETKDCIINAFSNTNIKLEGNEDYLGVELCGAIKNVIAIACGVLDGLNANESTKAMLITNSINDIKKLIIELGGNESTILTYAGIGDLILTCTSSKSRNFSFGRVLAQGTKEEINNYVENNTIEGRHTLKSINQLLIKKQIKIPIIDLMYKIVYQKENAKELLNFLMETK